MRRVSRSLPQRDGEWRHEALKCTSKNPGGGHYLIFSGKIRFPRREAPESGDSQSEGSVGAIHTRFRPVSLGQ